MTDITILGIDLAKNVFELCGLSADGEVVYSRSVKRKDFLRTVSLLSANIYTSRIPDPERLRDGVITHPVLGFVGNLRNFR